MSVTRSRRGVDLHINVAGRTSNTAKGPIVLARPSFSAMHDECPLYFHARQCFCYEPRNLETECAD